MTGPDRTVTGPRPPNRATFGIAELGNQAGGQYSAVTVPGRTLRSTDAGCKEVTSLAPGPLDHDRRRANGQGHRAGGP